MYIYIYIYKRGAPQIDRHPEDVRRCGSSTSVDAVVTGDSHTHVTVDVCTDVGGMCRCTYIHTILCRMCRIDNMYN